MPISTSNPVRQIRQSISTPTTPSTEQNNTQNLLNLGINKLKFERNYISLTFR